MPTVHVPAFTAHTIHDIAHTYIDVAPVQADHIVTTRNGAPRTCTVRVSADAVIRLVRRRGSKAFTVELRPTNAADPRQVTASKAARLELVSQRRARLVGRRGRFTVTVGTETIPADETAALLAHGWLSTLGRDRDDVTVSCAGRLALAAHEADQHGADDDERAAAYTRTLLNHF